MLKHLSASILCSLTSMVATYVQLSDQLDMMCAVCQQIIAYNYVRQIRLTLNENTVIIGGLCGQCT